MPPNSLRPPSPWVQLTSLLFIEMTNWRWSWRSMLVTGTLAPLLSILGLGIFARDSGPQALAYVLTGNLVLSLMFGNMGAVQSHVAFLRFRGSLEYFATLPVRRSILVLAMVLAFTALSAPSLVVTLAAGSAFLQVPLRLHPLLLVVAPLCSLPLAGIGALIGATARTPEVANSLTLVVTLALIGLGPVIIPPDRLPAALLVLGRFSPATYAASALRQAVLGPVTGQVWIDLAVLAGVGALVFWVVGKKLDWRVEG
jgi:ABC-2 type transport system permease protein